jgi:hypothetical protein
MDDVERYLGQVTAECLAACINLGADTETTLRLVRRASGFLHELATLYGQREQRKLDAYLQEWAAHEDAAKELLKAPQS